MEVIVEHRKGRDLPEGFAQLAVKEIWIVSAGETLIAFFFNAEAANAYAHWLQEQIDAEPEPEPPRPRSGQRPG